MRRLPWDIVLALLAGIGMGVVYAWLIAPLNVTAAEPNTLRADFKDQYRAAIAAAYAATGNLPRARARLELLQDPDPIEALNAQAQRMLGREDSPQTAEQVAALALALEAGEPGEATPDSGAVTESVISIEETSTAILLPLSPELTFVLTETPPGTVEAPAGETLPAVQPTSRPTRTPVPTPSAPFKLTGQDELCDPNLPDGLLQIIVLSSNRRQMPGIEIDITWEGDAEKFFTGLKPELGAGYADFIMTPGISYTVQLSAGSDIATGLTAPTCQSPSGETFYGGLKLTFQQP